MVSLDFDSVLIKAECVQVLTDKKGIYQVQQSISAHLTSTAD